MWVLLLILMVLCFGQNAPPFDGKRAMDLLITQCEFGPRFPESTGHKQMKKFSFTSIINWEKNRK